MERDIEGDIGIVGERDRERYREIIEGYRGDIERWRERERDGGGYRER